jgi:hypothetical protein
MKRQLLFALFALTFCTGARAQRLRIGPEVGLNFSNMTVKYEDNRGRNVKESGDFATGLRLGLVLDAPLDRNFYLQPGFFFMRKGYADNIGPYDYKFKVNYLEIPVNLLYKSRYGRSGRFFIGGGPYLAVALGGKVEDEDGRDYSLKIGNNYPKDDIRRLDLGINITTGYEFRRGLFLRGNAGLGVANVAPGGDEDYRLRNWGLGLSIGYLFAP